LRHYLLRKKLRSEVGKVIFVEVEHFSIIACIAPPFIAKRSGTIDDDELRKFGVN
jgi:hypothetical protein